ncbi:MAG: proton-conducting transporter membrane subunit [bacterium]|nr:proton-conducting transporter membrane subunit [bacterium]
MIQGLWALAEYPLPAGPRESLAPAWVLLAVLAVVPLVGLAGLLAPRRRVLEAVSVAASLLTLGLVAWLWTLAGEGALIARVPGVLAQGLVLVASREGLFFALISAGLWLAATVFAVEYIGMGPARTRYYLFSALCLASLAGFYLAADFFTLFIFFEVVSLGSYVLVVHEQTDEALAAGRLYLYLGIFGGLSILGGLALLVGLTGGTAMGPAEALRSPAGLLAVFALCLGFAIKAGQAPLHFWLPRAHPVAPTPASALLSGVIIKTGVYGILRSVSLITPGYGGGDWGLSVTAGQVLLVVALTTMLLGAFLALFQDNAKRLLAYSSVSQMGYIGVGLAMTFVLAEEGAMGLAGMGFHVLNHALYKSTLFMLVGVIYLKVHRLDLASLKGAGRGMPLVGAAFLVATFGIAGVPGLNGYASKTLIHDALLEGIHHGMPNLRVAEILFTLGSMMTVAYVARLFYTLFLCRPDGSAHPARETSLERGLALGLGLTMLYVGLRPNVWLEGFVLPLVNGFGYAGHTLKHLHHFEFFAAHPLQAVLPALGLGGVLFLFLRRRGFAIGLTLPSWSVERVVARSLRCGEGVCRLATVVDSALDPVRAVPVGQEACRLAAVLDSSLDPTRAVPLGQEACRLAAVVDSSLDPTRAAILGQEAARLAALVDSSLDPTRAAPLGREAARLAAVVDSSLDPTRAVPLGREAARLAAMVDSSLDPSRAVDHGRRAVGAAARLDAWLSSGSFWLRSLGPRLLRSLAQADAAMGEGDVQPAGLRRRGRSLMNLNVASLVIVGVIMISLLVFVFMGGW